MKKIEAAILMATHAHAGQEDLEGVPYIYHPIHVMSSFLLQEEQERIVAILHDIVEDTPINLTDIEATFGKEIAEAIDAITKRPGEDYDEYLKRVAQNILAKKVKIEDVKHNLDRSRASSLRAKDTKEKKKAENRVSKYNRALDILIPERKESIIKTHIV